MVTRPLTLVLPYFQNAGMLVEQQRVWADYAPEVRAQLHVIVVDDCSPKGTRVDRKTLQREGLGSLRVYRCTTKVRWNWLFGRNLGMQQASTEWVLLTDIDHVLPPDTARTLMTMSLDAAAVYRLQRVDAKAPWPYRIEDCGVREAKRFHPNTWYLTRAMYDRIGGYDERLSGCYGTDGEFRDRVQKTAKAIVALPAVMVRYGREIIPDASTPPEILTRKNDPANDDDLRRRRAERDQIPGWRPLRVTFPYEQVA